MALNRKAWKAYFKARVKELQREGLSGALASKAANAEAKALAAVEGLFAVFDELKEAGRSDMAGMLWVEFYASLIIGMPKEDREKFMKIVLKVAEEMEEEMDVERDAC